MHEVEHFFKYSSLIEPLKVIKNLFFLDVYSLPESFGLNEMKSGRLSKRSSYFLPAEQKKAGNVGLDWSQESNDLLEDSLYDSHTKYYVIKFDDMRVDFG